MCISDRLQCARHHWCDNCLSFVRSYWKSFLLFVGDKVPTWHFIGSESNRREWKETSALLFVFPLPSVAQGLLDIVANGIKPLCFFSGCLILIVKLVFLFDELFHLCLQCLMARQLLQTLRIKIPFGGVQNNDCLLYTSTHLKMNDESLIDIPDETIDSVTHKTRSGDYYYDGDGMRAQKKDYLETSTEIQNNWNSAYTCLLYTSQHELLFPRYQNLSLWLQRLHRRAGPHLHPLPGDRADRNT